MNEIGYMEGDQHYKPLKQMDKKIIVGFPLMYTTNIC